MDLVRYGIIGTGMMGFEQIRNLRLLPGARVTALADPHEPSRRLGLAAAGAELEVYDDPRELPARAPVDAVVVATPNHTHAAVLEDVFRTTKHVLVEKPLCTTLDDCRRVVEAAQAHPGVVWVGMEYRYMPPVARLLAELRAGSVGRLRMLAIREHRFPFLRKVGDWNRFARNTGGTLVEKCCHFFDLMHLIVAARLVRVYASGAQDVNHLDESYAVVVGRREPKRVETFHVPVEPRILEAGFHHGTTYFEHAAFLDAVRGGGQPEVSALDGLRAVALGLAAERSIAERRPVELAEWDL